MTAPQPPTPVEEHYRYHTVAFLDLMGQRDQFREMVGVPGTPDGEAELKRILGRTVGHIREFRRWFKDMFDAYQGPRPIPEGLDPKYHDEWRRMGHAEIHLQSVSDAVIAWSPIQTNTEADIPSAMNGLWGILGATSTALLMSLATEHPVRGGIEIDGGITIEPNTDEIYGRALNTAYELEQRTADYPRVVIGRGLVKFLQDMSNISGPAGTERYIGFGKMSVERCRKLIAVDSDGQPFVHFLGAGAREMYASIKPEDNEGTRKIVDGADEFVRVAAIRYQRDPKLGPRYKKLRDYFDRNIGAWRR